MERFLRKKVADLRQEVSRLREELAAQRNREKLFPPNTVEVPLLNANDLLDLVSVASALIKLSQDSSDLGEKVMNKIDRLIQLVEESRKSLQDKI